MNTRSDSITWQSWSQKWGDWTSWFRKADLLLKADSPRCDPQIVSVPRNSPNSTDEIRESKSC